MGPLAPAAAKRLFVAVPLDDGTRAAVAALADRLRAKGLRGRFVPAESYHVTLAFMGNVRTDAIERLRDALDATARGCAPSLLPLERVASFPGERRARTVWLGPLVTPHAFLALHAALLRHLGERGFAREARPQPHVTLCRCDGVPLPRVSVPANCAPVRVDALALYSSRTLPQGPQYALEHRVALSPTD